MPEFSDLTNDMTTVAKDAAYVVVGLGVLGFQKAQVQRNELQHKLAEESLDERVSELRQALLRGVVQLDELLEQAFEYVESHLEPFEEQLPQTAKDLAQRTHTQAREVRGQIRARVIPAA
jgi:uncharacterized protein YicC (UPF0701 family)